MDGEKGTLGKAALTLNANQIKKTISGSKVQKRKAVVKALESPFIYDWYFDYFSLQFTNNLCVYAFRCHLSAENETELLSSLLK